MVTQSEPAANDQLLKGDFSVLIVDDDIAFLDLLDAMLKSFGVKTVIRADSGLNAFAFLSSLRQRLDCIISDLKMMNGNGLQLLKDVRMGAFKMIRPDAAFILLTAIKHPLAVTTAGQLDVSGYITKPVTEDALKAALIKARTKYFPLDFKKYAAIQVPGDPVPPRA